MSNRVTVSVCMATFNGERHVRRQIETILSELSGTDELIIVDDCSTDRTVEVICSIEDPRISVHRNAYNQRQVKSFATAIALARNDVVFLADQDDVWIPGRVDLMCEALQTARAALVASNFEWVDEAETPIDLPLTPVKQKELAAFPEEHFRHIHRPSQISGLHNGLSQGAGVSDLADPLLFGNPRSLACAGGKPDRIERSS